MWMPLEAFIFKSSHWKHKETEKEQIENSHRLGMCVSCDLLWEIITLQGINSHFSFLKI